MIPGCNLLLCMSNPSAKPQGRPPRDELRYEKRDANAKWIFGIVGFLVVAGLIMHLILAGMMERLGKRAYPTDTLNGVRQSPRTIATTSPRLQIVPPEDLEKFRAAEQNQLDSYGWINRTAGVVRIPVARAMDLVLERGLPVRSQTNAAATGSSSYRLQQQRPQSPQPEIKEAQ
jgi:hypothetical protein